MAKRAQESPKGAQGSPKSAQERPEKAPRRPQERPKRAPREPKTAQREPKTAPRGPKKAQDSPRQPQEGHKRAQDSSQLRQKSSKGTLKMGLVGPKWGKIAPMLLQQSPETFNTVKHLPRWSQDGPELPKMLHFSLELLWTFVLGHLGPLCLYLRIVFTALSFRLRFDFLVLLFCICFASPFLFQWQGFPNNKPSIGQHN